MFIYSSPWVIFSSRSRLPHNLAWNFGHKSLWLLNKTPTWRPLLMTINQLSLLWLLSNCIHRGALGGEILGGPVLTSTGKPFYGLWGILVHGSSPSTHHSWETWAFPLPCTPRSTYLSITLQLLTGMPSQCTAQIESYQSPSRLER